MVDGVMPSNEGRGYVLRRIMRRAMRHANMLGINEPFIYKLVPSLVSVMGDAYPELTRGAQMVADTIEAEEHRFIKTLNKGMKLLEVETENLKQGDTLSGEVAFKLYDTYGFPLDLTQDALKAKNIEVDIKGFEKCMTEQRERAKAAQKGGTGQTKLADCWYNLRDKIEPTEFLGYKSMEAEALVLAIVKDDKQVEELTNGSKGIVVTNQTPFYAESGGQAGDVGCIFWKNGKAKVTDTQKVIDGTIFQHFIEIEEGTLTAGSTIEMGVCTHVRELTEKNHSVTHLLHSALHEVLGENVFQKGSQVTHEKTRFDFSHNKAMTVEEIQAVEDKVNAMIWKNVPVTTKIMDKEKAIEFGAMALFGEKYDDEVRVVIMGEESTDNKYVSVELCGGTHVKRTGDIGMFKIAAETSIASGIRRIEGLTGATAFNEMREMETAIKTISQNLKTKVEQVPERVSSMQKEIKNLKKEIKEAQKAGGAGGADLASLVSNAEKIGDISFIGASLENAEPSLMREMVEDLKNQIKSGVVILGSNNGKKSTLVAGVTPDLTSKFKAGDIVNAAAATLGGKGGGRPELAMAGGNSGDINKALGAARGLLVG